MMLKVRKNLTSALICKFSHDILFISIVGFFYSEQKYFFGEVHGQKNSHRYTLTHRNFRNSWVLLSAQ